MSRMTLEQAARWCGGTVAPQYAQVSFLGASNDSRSLEPGQLFVALRGRGMAMNLSPGPWLPERPPCCAAAATETFPPLW
ncbi:MAG: hypothetical protein ACLU9S_19300 [Oscillospiraceae bacterium]